MTGLCGAFLLLVSCVSGSTSESIVLKASTVVPVTGPPLSPGYVTIAGDRIIAVGELAPEGRDVTDLGDAWLTPGFIDAGWRAFGDRVNDSGASRPAWQWSDALDREQNPWPAWEGGVTAALAIPVGQESVDGWAPLVRFSPDGLEIVRARALLVGSLVPALERTSELQSLLLDGARAREAWRTYEDALRIYRQAERAGLASEDPPRIPGVDPSLAPLARVLAGEIPLRLRVEEPAAVQRLIEMEQLEDVRFWIAGEWAPPGADILRERAVVSLAPRTLFRSGTKRSSEARDWLESEWTTVFASEELEDPGYLRLEAARAIAKGAAREDVLAALTLVPARELGVADELGSLSPGCRADLVLWTGDPFDPRSKVQAVIFAGQLRRMGAN